MRVNLSLQEDFSLNHALSLYLIDTLALLDPMSETYALDVLTLVESILESPDQILRKQLDRVKTEKMFEMKAAGVEYDERMEELEKLEHPKPLRDFIYSTFNAFSEKHPWVGTENIRPKSIAREMFETYQSFADYVREYELQRVEGLLLRYLSDVYRALVQTVPSSVKNDDLDAITEYFGSIIQQIDSSLIDEWERIRNPLYRPAEKTEAVIAARDVDPFRDARAVRIKVMNEVFRFVRALAIRDFETALAVLASWTTAGAGGTSSPAPPPTDLTGEPWTETRLEELVQEYVASGHTGIRTDPESRRAQYVRVLTDPDEWRIEQTLIDPDGHDDWQIAVTFSLNEGRAAGGRLIMRLAGLGAIGI